jgi:hypothetical protein
VVVVVAYIRVSVPGCRYLSRDCVEIFMINETTRTPEGIEATKAGKRYRAMMQLSKKEFGSHMHC